MRAPNKAIRRERHITPTIEDIVAKLSGSTVFIKVNLNAGYHQLELEVESCYITTFSTHNGLFCHKRLNFGILCAAEIFQNIIADILNDIPGVINVSDHILLFAPNQMEHDKTLRAVLQTRRQKGLALNAKKCEFCKSQIGFFGHTFSDKGLSPDMKKVEAVKNSTTPRNKEELQSCLGMVTYLGRFIPNMSHLTEPLR